jgi:hypothetical protein
MIRTRHETHDIVSLETSANRVAYGVGEFLAVRASRVLGIFPQTDFGAEIFKGATVPASCLAGWWPRWHHGKGYHPHRTRPGHPGMLAAYSPTQS